MQSSAYILVEVKNYALFDLYVVLTGIYIIQRSRTLRHYGTVLAKEDKTKQQAKGNRGKLKRLEGAIIHLFDEEFKTLRATALTNKYGRFTLYVPTGKYYLTCQAKDYTFNQKETAGNERHISRGKFYDGGIIALKNPGYISTVTVMEKLD